MSHHGLILHGLLQTPACPATPVGRPPRTVDTVVPSHSTPRSSWFDARDV